MSSNKGISLAIESYHPFWWASKRNGKSLCYLRGTRSKFRKTFALKTMRWRANGADHKCRPLILHTCTLASAPANTYMTCIQTKKNFVYNIMYIGSIGLWPCILKLCTRNTKAERDIFIGSSSVYKRITIWYFEYCGKSFPWEI